MTAGGDIIDSGVITNDGQTATLDAGTNAITLDQSSDFGTLDVNGAVTNLAVTDVDDIIVAAVTTSGTLQVTAGGAVSDSGTIVAGGATTISNAGATVILDEAANNFAAIGVTGTTVTLVDTNGIDLAATTATGALSVTAGGAVSDSGTIVAGGATTISNAGATVILDEAANNFAAIGVTGTTVTLVDTNGIDLAATTATGALSVTAGGDIIDSGVITNDGQTATLDAGANAITLDQSSDFGTLDVNGAVTNLAVTDVDDIILAAVTTSGTLQVTAGGAVSDSGTIVAGGATTISNAGATVILDEAANNFAAIGVTGTTVTLVDTNGIDLAATTATGALSVTAGGDIIDSGVITNDGQTATLDAGANAITLDQSSDFGTLDVNGAVTNLAVTDVDDIILAAVTTSGTLQVTAGGAVSDSGTIVAGGATTISNAGATVILDEAANNFAAIGVTGTTVTLVDTNGIDLAATTATGALSVTAVGAITQTGAIDADSTSSFGAGGNAITLTEAGNDFTGAVSLSNSGGNAVQLTDTNALDLGTVVVGQNLTITATGGALTDSGNVTVAGVATIVSTGQTVTLGDATTANFGSLDFAGAAVTITEGSAMEVAASEATGALALVAGGAITQTGAIDADSTSSFGAGGNAITLTEAGNDFTGAVSLSNSGSNDVGVTDANAIDLGTIGVGQNLAVTASGGITDTGVATVAGTSTFDNSGGSNAAIDLDSASTYTGDVTFTTDAGSNVTINDSTAFAIQSGLNVNNLNLTAGGTVTDAGNIDIDGTLTVSAAGQTVTLDGAGNDVTGNVTLTGAAVTLVDTTATLIAGITATGALSVTTGGAITQSGAIDADSTSSFGAGGNAITLTQAGNDFTGAVSLSNSGGNAVQLTDTNALDLGTVVVGQNLTITATGGALTDSGNVTVAGVATIVSTGQTVTLGDATTANFGSLDFAGAAVTITEGSAMEVAASEATGALALVASGAITQTGAIAGSSTSSFTTTADDDDITLTHANNALVGAITLVSTDTNTDNTEIVQLTNNTAGGTILAGSTNTGTLTVVSTLGAITQTGALNVGSTSSFTASANDAAITLSTITNALTGNVTVSSQGTTGHVTIDNGTTALGVQGTANGNLALTSGQAITDSAVLTVSGTTTATTDVADKTITLGTLASTGDVSLNSSGTTGNAVVNNTTTALGLATSTIGGTLTAETDNSITVNGTVTSAGTTSVSASDDVVFAAAGALASGNGNITVTADDDNTPAGTGGAITMADGSTINSGTGTITLSADESVVLGGLTTTNATANAVAITSDNGSITDGGDTNTDISATNANAIVTLTAKTNIGLLNADNVLVAPTNALETAITNISAVITDATGDIALDNTTSGVLTLNSVNPDADGTAALWIRNSNGITVGAGTWTINNNDSIALIATAGNVTFPDGGAGVIDASGNLVNHDISVGTGKVRLEAAAGIVKDDRAVTGGALVIAASDLVLKSNTLNNETTGAAVGDFAAGKTVELATLLTGSLDVDVNSASQELRIIGANSSGVSADLKIADLDSDALAISTNAGALTVNVLNGITTAAQDDADESTPTLSIANTINTNNANIELNVLGKNVAAGGNAAQVDGKVSVLAGAVIQSDGTNNQLGITNFNGDVNLVGQVFANADETISISAPSSNIVVQSTGVAGSGVLTLSPGAGFEAVFQPGANVTVVKGVGVSGNLIVKNATNVTMDPTSSVVVDGSVDIGHGGAGGVADSVTGNITLTNITLDANGDGDGAGGSAQLKVKSTNGNITLAGTIDLNADPDSAAQANDIEIIAENGSIINGSGSAIAIDEVDNLTLTAKGSIGSLAKPLTVNAKTISLTSTSVTADDADIYINNNPNVLNLDSSATGDTVTLATIDTGIEGKITYRQTGQKLKITGPIKSYGGDILIDPPTDLTINATINGGGGSVTAEATGNITFGTTGFVTTSGTGNLLIQADVDVDGTGDLAFTEPGTAGFERVRTTGTGTIQLRGENVVTENFSAKTTSGKIEILAGRHSASTGEVYSKDGADGNFDLSAVTFDIEANGAGIGQSGGNTLEIVSSGQVDAEADGAIHITSVAGNALSVGLIDAGANTVTLVGNNGVTAPVSDAATDVIATTLTINDGAAGSAGTITLDTAVATLNLIGGTVTIHDGGGIDITSITATSLDLLTNGKITDSGDIDVTGEAKFNSTGNEILLGDGKAADGTTVVAETTGFGWLDFAGGVITISEDDSMAIAASEATGALSLTANGAITQTTDGTAGPIDAISTSSFNSGANVITLTQANDFAGAVSLSNTGTNLVQVTDANAIDLGTVNVGGALNVTSTGTITDTGNLTVVGLATLVSGGNAITLGDGTTAAFGSIDFAGSTVTITESDAMVVEESEATGALSLTASGAISQTGRIDAGNTSLFVNTGGTNDSITLTTATNDFTGAVSVTASDATSVVSITDANAIDLGAVSIGDAFTVTSTGAITDSGNITVGGLALFNSGGNLITLGDSTTAAFASIDFAGSTVSITEGSAMSIAASKATGALNLTATGAITQTGAIDADGTSSISAGANAITLDEANDFTGAVSLSNTGAKDVSITDVNALDLGTVGVGQDLTVTTGGTLSDSGVVSVPGLATIVSTGQTVTLGDTTTANFGSLDFAGAAVTITEDSAMAIAGSEATGALSLTANGAITQTGAIDAGGTSSFTAGANAITLPQATNDFTGAVSLTGGVTSLKDANDLTVSLTTSGTAALTAVNSLTVNGTVSGATSDLTTAAAATSFGATTVSRNLSVTASGAVSDTDKLAVAGTTTISATGQTVELDTATNDFTGAVTVTGGATILKDATDLTVSLTTSGTTAITAVNSLTLDGTVSGATSDLTTTAAATSFGTTAVGRNLSATASGNISQTGALDVEGTSIFTTQTNDTTITLTNVANEFTGAVSLISTDSDSNNEEAVQFTNSIATILGGSTESGSLVVVSKTGNISQTGSLDVDTTSSFTTEADDADITLGHTSNALTGAISLVSTDTNADNTEIVQLTNNTTGGTILAGSTETGTLSVTSTLGNISQTGALNVGSTSSFSTSADDGDITLTHVSNALVGAISLVSTDTNADNTEVVQLINNTTGGTILGGSTETGTLSVTSTLGSITQTGALNIGSTASFTTSADDADITLNEAANALTGAITLISTDTDADDEEGVAITNSIATVLGGSTQSGTLSVTSANGNITQTGSLDVDGITTISAATNSITLDNAANDFTGTTGGVVNVTGGATSLKDVNNIDLGQVSTSTLDLVAGTEVTDDAQTATVTGATKVEAGTDIVLDTASNTFGELTLKAGNEIAIRETGSMSGTAAAQSLQARATTGIEFKSGTAVSKLAALSDAGDIKIANTGGLTISPVASFTNNLGLSGIELSGGAEAKVEVLTQSPITVDAPITNETVGKIILAAQGTAATDDVTINSTITGDAVEVYAGDTITLSSTASLQVKDASATYTSLQVHDVTSTQGYGTTKLHYGTNYDAGALSAGFALADDVVISDLATLESILEIKHINTTKLVIYGPSRRLLYVTDDQNQEYFIALDPSVELAGEWNRSDLGNVLISNELTTGSFFQSEEVGTIEIEELEEK